MTFKITRGHSWSFVVTRSLLTDVVTRGHSCVLLDKTLKNRQNKKYAKLI